jgi:transposase-like protein
VQGGIKGGDLSDTSRQYGIPPNLFYRWKDEAEEGAKAALAGEALPRPKPRRTAASRNQNGRWDGNRWRSKSQKMSWGTELRCRSLPGV